MSFNRYSYANNMPFRYIDPDGRDEHEVIISGKLVEVFGGNGSIRVEIDTTYGEISIDAVAGVKEGQAASATFSYNRRSSSVDQTTFRTHLSGTATVGALGAESTITAAVDGDFASRSFEYTYPDEGFQTTELNTFNLSEGQLEAGFSLGADGGPNCGVGATVSGFDLAQQATNAVLQEFNSAVAENVKNVEQ